MRFTNQKYKLKYLLESVNHDRFCDGLTIDIDLMIEDVSTGRFASKEHKDKLVNFMARHSTTPDDLLQLTSGHDFCAALGLALRNHLGTRKVPQTWRREVEMHLRLAFSLENMSATDSYLKLKAWEGENPGYEILRKH